MTIKKIENYQLKELEDKKLLINKYDLNDLSYSYELTAYWKELFFDIIAEMNKKYPIGIRTSKDESLFDYLLKNYYNIINENKLNIDLKDYVEISDYITYKEWAEDPKHLTACSKECFYLIEL